MRFRPYLILAALWLLYFHPLVLHPTHTLYAGYSDFLAEHLPAKLFLNREWRSAGELPLWNPYHFCGSPFVHDIQVGVFYPPYAVTYLVPEVSLGAALSWVIALHVLAAGVFAFLYARSHGLGEVGGLVAAVGFMLSAKWMTHLLLAGHTVTVGLAWLPLVLLRLEHGIATGRAWPVVRAGVAFALLVLGTHPQWAFYAGVFAAAWTFPGRAGVVRWLVGGVGVVAVGSALAAVQLLPTLEAAGWSARAGGVEASGSLALGWRTALGLVGPGEQYDPPGSWELRGVFGVFWLAAAIAAPRVAGGRARWSFGVLLGLVFFSVGGAVLVEWLPGFRSFRVPGRMLLIAPFPIVFLAGVMTDALIRSGWSNDTRAGLSSGFRTAVVVAVVPTVFALYLGANGPLWTPLVVYWAVVIASLPVFVWVLRNPRPGGAKAVTAAWVGILLAELVAPTITFPAVRPQHELYPESDAVGFVWTAARLGESRVLDRDVADPWNTSALGTGAPLALTAGVEAVRGYNPLDVRHFREFLAFVIGDPDPVRGNSPLAQQVVPNFEIGNRRLFDLLNARYVIAPATDRFLPDSLLIARDPRPPAVPPLRPGAPSTLPPHVVTMNPTAFPRVWVVPEAVTMPTGKELDALAAADFTRTVLLAGDPAPSPSAGPTTARITDYRPNRVTVQLDGAGGGFLVLADVWFPGWVCRVDGAELPVHRANHAFRAVAIPPGAKEAVFSFEPQSYRVGWWVSVAALGLIALGAIGSFGIRLLIGRRPIIPYQTGLDRPAPSPE